MREAPGRFMGRVLGSESDEVAGLRPHGVVQAEGAAHHETGAARGGGGQIVQPAREIARSTGNTALVQANDNIAGNENAQDIFALFQGLTCRGQGRVGIADAGFRHPAPTGKAFPVVGRGLPPECGSRTAPNTHT